MLELIFQGFMEWAYGLALECWEYFSSSLLDIMSMDYAYMRVLMICSSEDLLKICELLLHLRPRLREPLKSFHKGENSDLNRDCLSEDLKHLAFLYQFCHANEGPSCGWTLHWTMGDRLFDFHTCYMPT